MPVEMRADVVENDFPEYALEIRRATAADLEVATELIDEYCAAIQVQIRDTPGNILDYLRMPRSGIWLAFASGVAAGVVVLREISEDPNAGEMKRLYVRPRYRKQGIGSALIAAVERFGREHNLEWLYLDTKDDLQPALALYQRAGYEPCGRYNNNPQATIFLRKRLNSEVLVRIFKPGDEAAFRELNEQWIAKYFVIEEKDREVLGDPVRQILAPGGQIFMAIKDGRPIGCCALLAMPAGVFEVAKMAVAEKERRHGVGRKLLEFAIEYAKRHSAQKLYIETNHTLPNAIRLYESCGFVHIPPERVHASPYARANVFLERHAERRRRRLLHFLEHRNRRRRLISDQNRRTRIGLQNPCTAVGEIAPQLLVCLVPEIVSEDYTARIDVGVIVNPFLELVAGRVADEHELVSWN